MTSNTFKAGDRVRYIGTYTLRMDGALGTVCSTHTNGTVRVAWDLNSEIPNWVSGEEYTVMSKNIEPVEPASPYAYVIMALEKDLRDARADYAAMVDVKLTAQRNVEAADLRIIQVSNALIALKNL